LIGLVYAEISLINYCVLLFPLLGEHSPIYEKVHPEKKLDNRNAQLLQSAFNLFRYVSRSIDTVEKALHN